MPDIIAGSLNGNFPEMISMHLDVLSVLLNFNCNLKCKHCYLNGVRAKREVLSQEEWLKLFESAFRYGVKTLAFAGKEIFFDRRAAEIFFEAIRLRDRIQFGEAETQIGLITNGMLLGGYKDDFLNFKPNYIDVSVDGIPEFHNFIRGRGAFEGMQENLKWLSYTFPNKVWVTHTIFDQNVKFLEDFLLYFSDEYGITRFSVGFFKALGNTSMKVSLSEVTMREFVERIFPRIIDLRVSKKILVRVDLDLSQPYLVKLLLEEGFVNPNELVTIRRFSGRDVEVTLFVSFIPMGLWKAVRVTPDGYWLATEDILKGSEYDKYAVANVVDFNFDIGSIYQYGVKSERLKKLFKEYLDIKRKIIGEKNEVAKGSFVVAKDPFGEAFYNFYSVITGDRFSWLPEEGS